MSVITSLSKLGQMSTVSTISEVPVTAGLILYLDSSDMGSYDGGPTTNYFKATEGTFDNNGTGTFTRLRTGSYGGYIIKPTDVVYRYELGVSGCHYHGNLISTSSLGIGNTVFFSFDYFISAGTTIITDYLANFEGAGSGVSINNGKSVGTWQSASFSTTVTSGGGSTLNAYLYPGACGPSRLAADGFILYKNPQVEVLNYPSRFVFGPNSQYNTRGGTNSWKDLSGFGNDFTIQGNVTWAESTGFSNFSGNSTTHGNKIYRSNFPLNLKTGMSGQGLTVVVVARSTSVSGAYKKLIGNADTDNYIDLYQDPNGYYITDGGQEILYVDGVQTTSGTFQMINSGYHCYAATNLNGGTVGNPVYGLTIGNEPNSSPQGENQYPWVGDIAVVLLYNRVLSDAEIKQISNLYKDKYNY